MKLYKLLRYDWIDMHYGPLKVADYYFEDKGMIHISRGKKKFINLNSTDKDVQRELKHLRRFMEDREEYLKEFENNKGEFTGCINSYFEEAYCIEIDGSKLQQYLDADQQVREAEKQRDVKLESLIDKFPDSKE